jgi:hypothetical protein
VGLSVDQIAHETKRATNHSIQVHGSVDINVAISPGWTQTTLEGAESEVGASFDAGADEFPLSREYTEMRFASLITGGKVSRAIFAGP